MGLTQNHNEIVMSVDLDTEVDESIELDAVAAYEMVNHNEIVMAG